MSLRIYIQILVFLLILPTFALARDDIDGKWEGKDYEFTFWSSDIDGHWGELEYDINFWSSDIDGKLAGESFDINFWSSDIDGYLPCGDFDINIWSSELEGYICGNEFEFDLAEGENGKRLAFRMAIDELISYIPFPAQRPIRRRILQEKRERGWME